MRHGTAWLLPAAMLLACGGGTGTDISGLDVAKDQGVFDPGQPGEGVPDVQQADDSDAGAGFDGADLEPDTCLETDAWVEPDALAGKCPVADFMILHHGAEVSDGGEVLVQSTLEIIDQSYDPTTGGGIVGWEWSVAKPSLSADIFQPSPLFKSPHFAANVVGDYLFKLDVTNKAGFKSCKSAEVLVHVNAGKGCHIELTWSTPKDPDPTDQCAAGKGCGADMDLHVTHPYAWDPYTFFDLKYDCFWFNPHGIWVEDKALDPDYQPHLDLDDTDGAGPENFNYVKPEQGVCYKVGVHYWDDHGFGASYPTIRMFIDGNPVYLKTAPAMYNLDMWEAGEACCSNKAEPFIEYENGGAPVIIPDYVNPAFIPSP